MYCVNMSHLLCLLVQVGDGDASRELGEVGVLRGHVGAGLRRQLIELRGRHAGVHALDHLLRRDDTGTRVC